MENIYTHHTSVTIRINLLKTVIILILFSSTHGISQDSFIVVGIHPGASAQNSVTGKQIATLFPWQGKLYAGYGDYGANTGPIDIYSFEPTARQFSFEWEANTEAIYLYRTFNDRVFAPAIDRKSYGKPGDYTMLDTTGIWGDYNFGSNSTHVFDVARLNESDIFMVGSQEERACVWHSEDNGNTWKKIHTDTAIGNNPEDFARYYFAVVFHGRLYVQAVDYYGGLHSYSETWDGFSWERDTSVFGSSGYAFGNKPDTFAGKIVLMSPPSGPNGYSSLLRTFDGISGRGLDGIWVFDFMVDSNYLYALVDSGFGTVHVKRTMDLFSWHTLARAPYGCRSLAIMNDRMYVGMNDSRIMEYTSTINDIVTRIEDTEDDNSEVRVYPNPCEDLLHLVLPWGGETRVSMLDLSGRVVRWRRLRDIEGGLYVADLIPGLYVLKMENGAGIYMRSIYKK